MSHLINYYFTLVLLQQFRVHNLSFHIFILKNNSQKYYNFTWCSYTPLQLHVLYTISGRGVTTIPWKSLQNFRISYLCSLLKSSSPSLLLLLLLLLFSSFLLHVFVLSKMREQTWSYLFFIDFTFLYLLIGPSSSFIYNSTYTILYFGMQSYEIMTLKS